MKSRNLFLVIVLLALFGSVVKSNGQVSEPINQLTSANSFLGSSNNFDVIFKKSNVFSGMITTSNTSFGYDSFSLPSNLSPFCNTAFGTQALKSLSAGNGGYNTAIGHSSLFNNTGANNSALGYQSLFSNTSGTGNVAFGYKVLFSNTAGGYNVGIGFNTLYYSIGSNNIGIGNAAYSGDATQINSGSNNIALGDNALKSNIGNGNIAIGATAHQKSNGSFNVIIGSQAGNSAVIQTPEPGDDNIAIGRISGTNLSGNKNILIGPGAVMKDSFKHSYLNIGNFLFAKNLYNLNSLTGVCCTTPKMGVNKSNPENTFDIKSDGQGLSGLRLSNLTSNIFPTTAATKFLTVDSGGDVILSNLSFTPSLTNGAFWGLTGNSGTNSATNFIGTTDSQDLVFRRNNAESGRIGSNNTSFGFVSKSSGINNINIGVNTGSVSTNPSYINNIAIGNESGSSANISGAFNVFLGGNTGKLTTNGSQNVFVGYQTALNNSSGTANTFIGHSSGVGNTTTSNNIGVGINSGGAGENNIAIGTASGWGNSGLNNIFMGHEAGYLNPGGASNGNIFLGYRAGKNLIGDNKLIIKGYNISSNLIEGDFFARKLKFNVADGVSQFSSFLEVNGNLNASGLRFTQLTNSAADKFLTTNASGDVVLQSLPSGYNITNSLTSTANTMTSNVNGVTATASIVNSLSNSVTGNTLTTTVNGISSSVTLPIPTFAEVDGSVTNELQTLSMVTNAAAGTYDISLSNGGNTIATAFGTVHVPMAPEVSVTSADPITTTVNNPTPNTFTIAAKNIYTDDGTLDSNRIVSMNSKSLIFNTGGNTTTTGGRIYIGNTNSFSSANFPVFNDSNPLLTRDYRLCVEGGVLSERMRVALRSSSNWADYIFDNDYKLMSLSELETYVKANKHLPGIESADELAKKGLDLGEMQAKQMSKIEELTLHLIEQNKTLEKQSKEIEELKVQVKLLLEKK